MDNGFSQPHQRHITLPPISAIPFLQAKFAAIKQIPEPTTSAARKIDFEHSRHAQGTGRISEARHPQPGKWTIKEERRMLELTNKGWGWTGISRELPGRSPIACRLHFRKALRPKILCNEEAKTNFARLYDRLKPEIWSQVAVQMGIPWRAAEAMHWHLGEHGISSRASGHSRPISNVPSKSTSLGNYTSTERTGQRASKINLPTFKEAFPDLLDLHSFKPRTPSTEYVKRLHVSF